MSNLLLNRWQSIDWSQSASQWLGLLLLAIWLWLAWPKEELLQLKRDKALQSRLFLSTLAINGLWLLNASITAGIHVHFLGIVTFMLMFGWRLATLAILLPVLFFCLFVMQTPFTLGWYGLLGYALPIFVAYLIYCKVYQALPHHVFVYIFGAFINAGLSIVIHILMWSSWLWLSGAYSWQYLIDNYLLLMPLLGFPEALLSGMAITFMVVYRPHWLFDYSDKQYF